MMRLNDDVYSWVQINSFFSDVNIRASASVEDTWLTTTNGRPVPVLFHRLGQRPDNGLILRPHQPLIGECIFSR